MSEPLTIYDILKGILTSTWDSVSVTQTGGFSPPSSADAVTVTYPSSDSEVYTYRAGGTSGTAVMTITVTYTNGAKDSILNVVRT